MARRSVFLVGPMGAGKTTVGRRLAQSLGLDFFDSDEEIERRTGATISIIFEIEGEVGFRKREHKVLQDLTALPGIVLATGGGAVLMPENRELLRARGTVVYLKTSVAEQLRRTRSSVHRPLLQDADTDPEARLLELTQEREPLYDSVADIVVESPGRKVGATVKDVLDRLTDAHSTSRPG
ncbi:shikimate kinase AroK [Immundisolibacter sp.]|uniref:shikimate kinase AroK n=1 Tax=Immundisolibacter sp. TaxID=1934948 RepID=UPI0035637967